MRKLYRSVLLTSMVAVGLAGCGDDVTIVDPPAPPAPTVKSISVGPNPGTVQVGQTITMSAAVTADEGVATTVTWSSSDAAKATVNATTGVVTGVSAGSVAITATSTVNPAVQGVATVNVVAAPTATVTGVTVTPANAALVVGQTVQLSASVQGTNNPGQTVTWSSLSGGIASVSASGLVQAIANGTAVIRGCSTLAGFTNVCGSMSVTVTTPTPASVSIQSLTTGNLGTPVVLTAVAGQIEATVNVESGDQQLDRVDVLFGGQVIASQSFAVTPAPAEEGAAGAPVTVVLSFNTNQLRKVNNLFVPVIFNGPTAVTANLYIVGSSTPLASNAIPVVVQNADLMMAPTTFTQVATAGPIANPVGTNWYKGNVRAAGGNYVSFFPVTPTSITWATTGAVTCGSTGNMVTGTPQTGIALAGTATCGSSVENAVNVGGYSVTAGTAPAADVIYIAAAGFTQAGTAFMVAGENRYNPLAAAAPTFTNIFIDNKAPVITPNPIGFHAGGIAGGDAAPNNCEETGITPGCWVGTSYNLLNDFTPTDGGSGVDASTPAIWSRSSTPACTSTPFTIAGAAENPAPNTYDICYDAADRLGNVSAKVAGFNKFGVDKTAPTLAYVGSYGVSTVNPAEVNVLPAAPANDTINFSLTDNNAGVDATAGLTVTFTRLLNNGGTPSTIACSNPVNTLTGSGTTPQTMATPYLISSCTLPGERTWSATGRDRAGNQAGPVSRQLEYNPAAPMVAAVNIVPTYAAAADVSVDVLATDDEDLRSAELALSTTTNVGNDIRVVFGPLAGFFNGIWGSDWDANLFLANTLGVNSRLTLPAAYSLAGYAENPGAFTAGQTPIDTITTRVFDTFGTPSAAFLTALNPAFVNAASYVATTNPWAAGLGNVINAAFVTVGASCRFEYSTPTNNPEVFTRVWLVNDDLANTYTVLADINSQPTLISDNGIQRLYRYTISTTQGCAAISGLAGGANNMFAIKSNVAAIIF